MVSIWYEHFIFDVLIPDWIRNNAHWWIEEKINDDDFVTGLEFMIKEKIILIPNLVPSDSSETQSLIGLKTLYVGEQMV